MSEIKPKITTYNQIQVAKEEEKEGEGEGEEERRKKKEKKKKKKKERLFREKSLECASVGGAIRVRCEIIKKKVRKKLFK